MKATLFTIALLAISFSGLTQGPNAFRLTYVIKSKKLSRVNQRCIQRAARKCQKNGKCKHCEKGCGNGYDIIYVIPNQQNHQLRWGNTTVTTTNDSLPVLAGCPASSTAPTSISSIGMSDEKLKCYLTPKDEGVRVDFWKICAGNNINIGCINGSTPLGQNYFVMPFTTRRTLNDPHLYVKANFHALSVGVGVTNFRYRAKEDSTIATVSTGLNLSLNLGYMWGYSYISARRTINLSCTAGGFLGMSSATLSSTSVKKPSLWNSADNRTNPAISYGANLIFSRNNLGLVLSFGFDSNIGPHANDWIYQHKPWIGLGINTSLGIF